MRSQTCAGIAAIALAGGASAAFTEVTVLPMGEIIDGTFTIRVIANFDSPDDQLLAVSAAAAPLRYSGAELVQNAPGLEGLQLQDVPFAAAGPGDSWVSIGGDVDAGATDTAFTPGLFNPAFAGASVINGSFFEQLENGGYFDQNPGSPENGGSVVIAQFTVAQGAVPTFEGSIEWRPEGGEIRADTFQIPLVPAPGALALVVLAGITGIRRRRV